MTKQITGKQIDAVALQADKPQIIKIAKGQQLRLQELQNGQLKDAANVLSARVGNDLKVRFVDGTEVVFENFFVECVGDSCSVTVGDMDAGSFTITADTPTGQQLADGSQLVHYSLADSSALMDLAVEGGEFIKTQGATEVVVPAVLEGASVAQAAAVGGGSGWLWGGLGLGLGLAGGGGGSSGPSLPDGFKGLVWDTPVSNAIVFRDLNGDGVWDANEPIAITKADGSYEGLTGVGDIVATSLDRLLWRTTASYVETVEVIDKNVSKLVPQTKTLSLVFEGAHFDVDLGVNPEAILELIEQQALVNGGTAYNDDSVIEVLQRITHNVKAEDLDAYLEAEDLSEGSGETYVRIEGELGFITGFAVAPLKVAGQTYESNTELVAIDIGPDLELDSEGNLPSDDDFVWSGTYVISAEQQEGSVNVYVTAVSSLVKAYMDANGGTVADAMRAIKAGLDFDQASGEGTSGSDLNVLTGELNAQLTRLMGEVIARVQASNAVSDVDVNQVVVDQFSATLEALAVAIEAGEIACIDLTNPEHLLAVFGGAVTGLTLNENEAEILALQVGAAGPATYSVWHTESESNVNDGIFHSTGQVVGNITVLSRATDEVAGEDTVPLFVGGEGEDGAYLQGSRVRAQAVDDNTGVYLMVDAAGGSVTDLDVLATGDNSFALTGISGDFAITGDVQVRSDGSSDIVEGEDSFALGLVGGENVELGTDDRGTNLMVSASGYSADAYLQMGRVSGHVDDITVQANGEDAGAGVSVDVAQGDTLTVDNITVSASGESADAVAYLRGGSAVDASAWAVADVVSGVIEIEGDIEVSASGLSADANLEINANVDTDFGATVLQGGAVAVEASGTDADAAALIRQASGAVGQVSVRATGLTQVDGFDFLSYFGPEGEYDAIRGMDIEVEVGGTPYSLSLDSVSNELVNNLPALLDHVVSELNKQLADENFHFAASYDGSADFKQGLFVVWDTVRDDEIEVTFSVDGTPINDTDFLSAQDGIDNSNAGLLLVTNDDGLTISSVEVLAESRYGDASADISGFITITGPISVKASEYEAEASADINSNFADPTVLGRNGQGASLTVTAEHYDASADLVIGNVSGVASDVTVTASSEDSGANIELNTSGTGLTISSLTVTASGEDSYANADANGPLAITGHVTVTANEEGADAFGRINNTGDHLTILGTDNAASNLTLSAESLDTQAYMDIGNARGSVGAITVDSTGLNSYAEMDVDTTGAGLTVASFTVTASSFDAYAYGDIDGHVAIRGNIVVDASAHSSDAYGYINESGAGNTVLGSGDVGSNITVTASDLSADAYLEMGNVSGTAGELNVTASGQSSDAHLDLEVAQDATLNLSSISITGTDDDADASIELRGASSADANPWTQPNLESGTIVVSGDISVTANATESDIELDINSGTEDFGATVLNVGAVDVIARATNADAEARIHNASGSVGDVTVAATGQPEVFGFDFLNYFGPNGETLLSRGTNFVLEVDNGDGNDLFSINSLNVSDEVFANLTSLLEHLVEEANSREDALTRGYRFATSYDGPQSFATGLFVIWDSIRDDSPTFTLNLDSNPISLVNNPYLFTQQSTQSSYASLDLVSDANGLTTGALSVVADAEGADAEANLSGVLTIKGDIEVTAAELSSDAEALINSSFNDLTTLGEPGQAIHLTVTASGQSSDADLEIGNASGTVAEIEVTASGNSADADLILDINDAGVTATSLTVSASGRDAYASADVQGTIAISGNIDVTATARSADANATINHLGSALDLTILGTALTGSNLTVTALGGSSDAELFIDNAQGLVGAMTVTASGETSDANFDFETSNTGVIASSLSVIAGSDDAFASADLDGTLTIKGNILVSATGECADATAEIGYDNADSITLGDVEVGSNLTVIADGTSADSVLDIGGASGLVGGILVDAEGTEATADLALQLEGAIDGDITVSAEGYSADAYADIVGNVAVRGDVTVNASGDTAYAQANINAQGGMPASPIIEAPVSSVFGRNVEGDVVGSNLSVTAEKDAYAGLDIGSASGVLNAVTVDATGEDSVAMLSVETTEAGITVTSVSVDASGEDSVAGAMMFGDVSITGDISVASSGEDALAYALLNPIFDDLSAAPALTTTLGREVGDTTVGSNITVAASGEEFYFGTEDVVHAAFVSQNTRGHVGELNVSSTGDSTDALALIGVKADEALKFDSLTVTVNSLKSDDVGSDSATATVYLYGQDSEAATQERWAPQQDFVTKHGTVEITGDITVKAMGVNDAANLHVNSGESIDLDVIPLGLDSTNRGYTLLGGGDITVLANATDASADVAIRNAQGTISDITVTAGGVPEVLGFDFLTYFSHINGVEIENEDTFTFTANSIPLTHEFDFANHIVPENPTAEFVNSLLEDLIAGLNAKAEEEGLGVHFSSDFDGASTFGSQAGLFAIWDTVRPDDSGVFGFEGDPDLSQKSGIDSELFFYRDGSDNTHADFELETENNGVTISTITVVASGEDGYADFDIEGAGVGITGDISVVASEYEARADADINDGNEESIDGPTVLGNGSVGSNITVTASAYSADAALDIEKASGTVGDMTVQALDDLASADLALWTTTDNLVANNLTVMAQGDSADATVSLDADGDLTLTGNIQITAEGLSADADVDLHGSADTAHFMIEGDITASAISEDARARLEIVDEQDGNIRGDGRLTLGTAARGSNITLSTDGEDAETHVHLFNVDGAVGAIEVESTGEDSWSHLELEAGADRNLTIETLTVRGIEGTGSSAEVEIWTANDAATLAITGNVLVSAEGVETSASADINNKSTGMDLSPTYSDGTVTFGNVVNDQTVGSDITVIAADTGSSAELRIYNAVGDIGDITLTATGVSEVQGFDFLTYFDHEEGEEIENTDTFSFTFNGVTLEHEFTLPNHPIAESPSAEFVRGLLDDVIATFNAHPKSKELGIKFVDNFDGETGLFAVWDSIRPENTGVFNFDGTELTDPALLFERNGSVDSYGRFRMETEQAGVTIASIAVTADAEAASADFDIEGAGIHLTGDISVVASEAYASADADINVGNVDSIDGPTVLGKGLVGSNITVTASAESADAALDIGKATGLVGDIEVSAIAESASADLELWSNADGLEARTLTVVAEGLEASADVEIDANGDFTLTGDIDITADGHSADADVEIHAKTADGHLFLQGDIRVTALSEDAGAYLEVIDEEDYISVDGEWLWVREEGQVTLGTADSGSNITVIADGQSADAHVHIYTAGGLVGAIDLQSSGEDAEAHLELEVGANRDLSIESLSIRSITGESSEAYAELWTAAASSNLSIKGDILLEAEGDLTMASLDINDQYDSVDLDDTFNLGTITFGEEVDGTTVGSNITVIASGDGASADADIYTARGTVGHITVAADGDSSGSAVTGIDARALFQYFGEIASGVSTDSTSLSLLFGDIEIEVSLDAIEIGNPIAFIDALNAQADLKNLGATFSGEGPFLYITWDNPSDAMEPTYAVNNLNSGITGDDDYDIFFDEVDVVISNNNSEDGDGFYNAIGPWFGVEGQAEELSAISRDGAQTTASLDMELNGVIDGNIDVSASGNGAESSVDLFGDMDLRGDVTVTASGAGAYASTDINRFIAESTDGDNVLTASDLPQDDVEPIQQTVFGRTTGNTTQGSDLTVSATGDDAEATLNVGYASGVVDAISVSATGEASDASLDLDVEANMTLQINTINVVANSAGDDAAYADATLNGQLGYDDQDPSFDPLVEQSIDHGTVQINGDITVLASGINDDATLNVNVNAGGGVMQIDAFKLGITYLVGMTDDLLQEIFDIPDITGELVLRFGNSGSEITFSSDDLDDMNQQAAGLGFRFESADSEADELLPLPVPNILIIWEDGTRPVTPTFVVKFDDPQVDDFVLDNDFFNALTSAVIELAGDDVPPQVMEMIVEMLESDFITTTSGGDLDSQGHTVLDGGDITITASATGADADAYIHNASGDVGDVRVTSTGVSQVAGFDFLAYFDPQIGSGINPNRLSRGDTFVVTLGDHTFSYEVPADIYTELAANNLLTDVVKSDSLINSLNAQAAGLGVSFAPTFVGGPQDMATGLFAVWDSVREEAPMTVAVQRKNASQAVEIENNEANEDYFWNRESSIDNAAYLEVIAQYDQTLTVASVSVTSEAEIAYNESDDAHGAWADFYGDIHVTGDITVTASELNSYAETWMNYSGGTASDERYGTTTLGLNGVGSNITVTASGQIAEADAQIESAEGTVKNIAVTASGAHKMFEMGDSEDTGYDDLCFMDLVNSSANLNLHLNGAITGNVQVLATNTFAEAAATITGLEADLSAVLVKATAQDAVAEASISFDDGVIDNVTLDAEHHRSTVLINIDQADPYALPADTLVPANTGNVTVLGEGHVGVTYYVDAHSSTAKNIDLSAMNEPLNAVVPADGVSKDWEADWGYLDLDLVAKTVGGTAQAQQTADMSDLLPKMIHIKGFNVQRDSINLRWDDTPREEFDDLYFSGDTVELTAWGITSVVTEADELELEDNAAYKMALYELLLDAAEYFNRRDTDTDDYTVGYFYREITFKLGSDSELAPTVTRSFMVYDHDVQSAGATGIISFGPTTGLTERNVAQRYTITHNYESGDTDSSFSDEWDGYHNITALSVKGLGEDAYVSYDLSDDADVMLGDITVTAFSADGNGDDVDVELNLDASTSDSEDDASLQLRQSNIYVAANGDSNFASLDIDGAWGTIASLTLEAINGSDVSVNIYGEDNFESDDTYFGHGIFVHDVRVMAGGVDSYASLDLDVNGSIQTLRLEVLGEDSAVSADIDQAEYGGQVFVSGSNLTDTNPADYCVDDIGDNFVTLVYRDATAQKITIDNEGRTLGTSADIEFRLELDGDDKDLFTEAEVWATRLTIEGWTQNDSFEYLQTDDPSSTNWQFLSTPEASFGDLLGNALDAINRGEVEYYFGRTAENGYLFYDDDNEGVTGVVEFLGMPTLDSRQDYYDWIFVAGYNEA